MSIYDRRIRAQASNRSLRDEIQPLLAEIEKADTEALHAMLPRLRRKLREIYLLARDFEMEVSRLRWNERSVSDAYRNIPLGGNVIQFNGRK